MSTDYALLRSGLAATLVAATQQIIRALPAEMSGNLKAQHLGVYLTIVAMTERHEDATTRSISGFINLARPHVNSIVNRLCGAQVIARKQVLSPHGSGRQFVYYPIADFQAVRAAQSDTDER